MAEEKAPTRRLLDAIARTVESDGLTESTHMLIARLRSLRATWPADTDSWAAIDYARQEQTILDALRSRRGDPLATTTLREYEHPALRTPHRRGCAPGLAGDEWED